MVGGDENVARDMRVFVAGDDRLHQATESAVLLNPDKACVVSCQQGLVVAVKMIIEARHEGALPGPPAASRRTPPLGHHPHGGALGRAYRRRGSGPVLAGPDPLGALEGRPAAAVLGVLVRASVQAGRPTPEWRDLQ
jgi:hypothetical protein